MSPRTIARAIGLVGLMTVTLLWASPAPPQSLTGSVVKVIDGDTIDVELDGRTVRVRYRAFQEQRSKKVR